MTAFGTYPAQITDNVVVFTDKRRMWSVTR